MKTAEEWYAHQGEWGDTEEFTELVRAIQADAIEAAAKDLERSLCFNEDGETSGPPGIELPIPPQELKWVESIRRLKPR